MLWMCSKWLILGLKKLHFRMRQKMITSIHKILKKNKKKKNKIRNTKKEKKNVDI